MGRTILKIAEEVCDRATTNAPSSLFGAQKNDTTARRLRTAAKDTLRDIMRQAMRNGASGFHAQWVFATRKNVYAYQLPPDLYKMLPGTEQRGRWPLGILGPVSPQTWSNWVAGLAYTAVPMGWRIKNNLIHLEPPPATEEIVVIEYLSRYLVVRDATDEDLEAVNGRLQPKLPLIPREGYVTSDAWDAVPTTGGSAWGTATWGTAVWGTTPTHELRRVPAGASNTRFPAYQVRAEEFTSDTDRCAIEDDHVLSLGMTWRLLKAQSRPYAEEYDEYTRERDVYLSNDASRGRIIEFGNDCGLNEVEPLGDGRWLLS